MQALSVPFKTCLRIKKELIIVYFGNNYRQKFCISVRTKWRLPSLHLPKRPVFSVRFGADPYRMLVRPEAIGGRWDIVGKKGGTIKQSPPGIARGGKTKFLK